MVSRATLIEWMIVVVGMGADVGYAAGLILGLRPANERRRYKVTPSLIGWAHT